MECNAQNDNNNNRLLLNPFRVNELKSWRSRKCTLSPDPNPRQIFKFLQLSTHSKSATRLWSSLLLPTILELLLIRCFHHNQEGVVEGQYIRTVNDHREWRVRIHRDSAGATSNVPLYNEETSRAGGVDDGSYEFYSVARNRDDQGRGDKRVSELSRFW